MRDSTQATIPNTVLVTGGASGIGRATAALFLRNGYDVAICDIDLHAAQQTADALNVAPAKSAGVALAYRIDVASAASVDATVEEVNFDFSGVGYVVNCAGLTRDVKLERMTDEEWQKVVAVNQTGTFNVNRATVRVMKAARMPGSIVNIASVSAFGNVGQYNYAATKAAVIAMTKTLAGEVARAGIRANVVLPGFTRTPMTDALSDKARTAVLGMIPIGRFLEPEEIADGIWHVAHETGSTGALRVIDGGLTACL